MEFFNSNRIADQVLGYPRAGTFGWRKLDVAGDRRWSRGCGRATKVCGRLRPLQTVEDAANLLEAPLWRERHDAAKAGHLALRNCMTGMRGQARREHLGYFWVMFVATASSRSSGVQSWH